MPIPSTGTFRINSVSAARNNDASISLVKNFGGDLDYRRFTDFDLINLFLSGGVLPIDYTNPAIMPANNYPEGGDNYAIYIGNYELENIPNSRAIIFNPGGSQEIVDILSSDFPTGFIATNVVVNTLMGIFNPNDAGFPAYVPFLRLKFARGVVYEDIQPDTIDPTTPQIISSPVTAITPLGTNIGIVKCLNRFATFVQFGNASSSNPFTSSNGFFIFESYVTGDYSTWSSTITLDPSTSMASPGSEVIITDVVTHKLDQIEEIKIYYQEEDQFGNFSLVPEDGIEIAPEFITTRTSTTLIFRLIPRVQGVRLPFGGKRMLVTGVGNGVQFSGEIALAVLNTLLVDGSGIYTLVPGKLNDTYYDRTNEVEITEIDLKIPDPFGRTGYF